MTGRVAIVTVVGTSAVAAGDASAGSDAAAGDENDDVLPEAAEDDPPAP